MILDSVCVGQFQVNCYILASRSDAAAIIIDPGDDEKKIGKALDRHRLKPAFIINTHGHIDHIGADDKFGVPVYVHSLDAALLRDPHLNLSGFLSHGYSIKSEVVLLEDKQVIELDDLQLEVIHTPGHTPGGICLLLKKPVGDVLFSGDTLFYQSVGRADFPGADERELLRSIKDKLLKLPDETVIYPGHGPRSRIGKERRDNPFLTD